MGKRFNVLPCSPLFPNQLRHFSSAKFNLLTYQKNNRHTCEHIVLDVGWQRLNRTFDFHAKFCSGRLSTLVGKNIDLQLRSAR